MMNDMLSPWPSLSLPLAFKKAVCAAQQVCGRLLPVDHSEPFPPQPRACTKRSTPPLPKSTSLLGTRAWHRAAPCCPQGPASCSWCPVGNLLSSVLTPSLIPAGPATCPGSQGKDPEFACSRLGQAPWGTRDRDQVLGAGANLHNFPGFPQGKT